MKAFPVFNMEQNGTLHRHCTLTSFLPCLLSFSSLSTDRHSSEAWTWKTREPARNGAHKNTEPWVIPGSGGGNQAASCVVQRRRMQRGGKCAVGGLEPQAQTNTARRDAWLCRAACAKRALVTSNVWPCRRCGRGSFDREGGKSDQISSNVVPTEHKERIERCEKSTWVEL